MTTTTKCVLTLDADRQIVDGSEAALCDAIRRGADLRIYTEFIHNEHVEPGSDNDDRVREVAEFGVTYLVEDRWTAGVMSLRQPIELPTGFGPRPSMSFFLYNQNGEQAIARPLLDGKGPGDPADPSAMPKYHQGERFDDDTIAPSHNFVYDFDVYRFCVADVWREMLSHDEQGRVVTGSLDALIDAFSAGARLKIAVRGFAGAGADHEMFVQAGPGYYYTNARQFMVGSHPTIRIDPAIPMRYTSGEKSGGKSGGGGWDFGWLMVRTDGHVVYRRCDPFTLAFEDREIRCPIRWFVQ